MYLSIKEKSFLPWERNLSDRAQPHIGPSNVPAQATAEGNDEKREG